MKISLGSLAEDSNQEPSRTEIKIHKDRENSLLKHKWKSSIHSTPMNCFLFS